MLPDEFDESSDREIRTFRREGGFVLREGGIPTVEAEKLVDLAGQLYGGIQFRTEFEPFAPTSALRPQHVLRRLLPSVVFPGIALDALFQLRGDAVCADRRAGILAHFLPTFSTFLPTLRFDWIFHRARIFPRKRLLTNEAERTSPVPKADISRD